ncbi:MAG: hypothetical protein V8Q43_01805 [Christensenellaceae bacterium]
MFGEKFVRGESMQGLAEGVSTSQAMQLLAKRSDTDIPICTAVYRMLYENISPEDALEQLFLRGLKKEFWRNQKGEDRLSFFCAHSSMSDR